MSGNTVNAERSPFDRLRVTGVVRGPVQHFAFDAV